MSLRPVSYDDGTVLLNMDEGRRRLEHLRRDPRVALTMLDPDSWYRHVSIVGHVIETWRYQLSEKVHGGGGTALVK
ncbi:MAG TPA: pyridoxamine 5'-phosphate oxidase family protein, partial [Candidatus Dormibacteraeota bacterium]